MQGAVRVSHFLVRGWLACIVATGCGSGPSSAGADSAVATGDGSNTITPALSVRWATEPVAIPGDAGSNVTISRLLFRVANLRVIGDAGPGDTRTSVDAIQLGWSQGVTPESVGFAHAPTGLYSRIILLADGNLADYSYEIGGSVNLDNVATPFVIHDRSPLAISLDTSATLDPGQATALTITVRIDQALQALDFHQLAHTSDGGLALDTFDNAMRDFREKMMTNVFESDDTGGHQ